MKKAKNNSNLNVDARSVAIYVLNYNSKTSNLQSSLDHALRKFDLAANEISLCTEIVYGFSRYQIRINAILDILLKKRQHLPLNFQLNLGISIYALLFLNGIPHYATVNWAVEYTKLNFGTSLAKLCNAVLRSFLRLEDKPLQTSFYNIETDFYSIPHWIYKLWFQSYGEPATIKLMQRSLKRPIATLRLNPSNENFDMLVHALQQGKCTNIAYSGYASLEGNLTSKVQNISMKSLHDLGAFSWQSAGSQLALFQCIETVPQLKSHTWWDACAGQGGKSLFLLEQGLKVMLCSDISLSRLKQFTINCNRLHLSCPALVKMSAKHPAFKTKGLSFLLDVPCSGLGTLSRRPDIKATRTPNDLNKLIQTQKDILFSCYNALSPFQYIIYLTCTLNPAENEEQIKNILNVFPCAREVFSWQTPHDHPWLEGMFVSVLYKTI